MSGWRHRWKTNGLGAFVTSTVLMTTACGPGTVRPHAKIPPTARIRVDGRRLAAAGFTVRPSLLTADLYQLRKIAIVAASNIESWTEPPSSPYDAILGFHLDTSIEDGGQESARFASGLALLSGLPAEKTVWADGLAGLPRL